MDCSFIGTPRLSCCSLDKSVFLPTWTTEPLTTFELQITKISQLKQFYCVLIYWPSGPAGQFYLGLLTSWLLLLSWTKHYELVILTCTLMTPQNVPPLNFFTFNFKQHVFCATHIGGHTLVFSLGLDHICWEDPLISGHKCIFSDLFVSLKNTIPASLLRIRLISSQRTFPVMHILTVYVFKCSLLMHIAPCC